MLEIENFVFWIFSLSKRGKAIVSWEKTVFYNSLAKFAKLRSKLVDRKDQKLTRMVNSAILEVNFFEKDPHQRTPISIPNLG